MTTSPRPITTAAVITIGDEILSGQTVDTNFTYLAKALHSAGVIVNSHLTITDEEERIVEAIARESSRVDLIVTTGGLGITSDDCTRPALARLTGRDLVSDPELLGEIEVFFRDRKIRMPAMNAAQAALPEGAQKIMNRAGLAPGIHITWNDCEILSFPGVPGELRALTRDGLLPLVEARNGPAEVLLERSLSTWGKGESQVARALQGWERANPDIKIAYLPESRGVTLRIRARRPSRPVSSQDLDLAARDIADQLGDLVYSTRNEELDEVVGYLLILYKKTVATAESLTGGRLADYLTSRGGSSRYFRGGFVPYQAEAKVRDLGVPRELIEAHGTVSHEVARAMAEAARMRTGADYGISLTGVAGPEAIEGKPVGLVYCALASSQGTDVRDWNLPGDRNRIKDRAARGAINQLRLALIRAGG